MITNQKIPDVNQSDPVHQPESMELGTKISIALLEYWLAQSYNGCSRFYNKRSKSQDSAQLTQSDGSKVR
ncbi:4065_t:CDS:2 [Rhizophagus irregularis]|nr:4065_t:CDS:2 [Rhizophagus irregularis]